MGKYDESYKHVLEIERDAINSLIDSLDKEIMDKIVDLLCSVKVNGHKVILSGCGTSAMAAKKISHSLNVIEVPSFFLSPADSIHGGFGAIQKGDVVVLVTKGGNTKEVINFLPVCKEKGAFIIGVSENEQSVLAKNCDYFLKIKIDREPCPWNMVATASTLAIISTWDSIIITAMQHNGFTKKDFLLIHPGGAVGDRLKE